MANIPLTLADVPVGGVTYVGGGTDLMPLWKNGVRDDRALVYLSRVREMQGIRDEGDHVSVGAAVTLREIAESPLLRELLPALSEAAAAVASPQIRSVATLGGNVLQDRRCIYFNQSEHWRSALPLCFKTGGAVCHQIPNSPVCRAIYYSDAALALLLYEAEAVCRDETGELRLSVAELIRRHSAANGTSFENRLRLLAVRFLIPKAPALERSGFFKYAMRSSIDFPLIHFALRCGGSRSDRIFAGAVAPEPVELVDTAALLRTDADDGEVLACAARELKTLAKPIREACISPARKRDLYAQLDALLPLRREV